MRGSELDDKLVNFFVFNMLKELIDKPMNMSDGTIGIVRSYDEYDMEFPTVEVGGTLIKTDKSRFCISQHMAS
jgi:hypothetical protein